MLDLVHLVGSSRAQGSPGFGGSSAISFLWLRHKAMGVALKSFFPEVFGEKAAVVLALMEQQGAAAGVPAHGLDVLWCTVEPT